MRAAATSRGRLASALDGARAAIERSPAPPEPTFLRPKEALQVGSQATREALSFPAHLFADLGQYGGWTLSTRIRGQPVIWTTRRFRRSAEAPVFSGEEWTLVARLTSARELLPRDVVAWAKRKHARPSWSPLELRYPPGGGDPRWPVWCVLHALHAELSEVT